MSWAQAKLAGEVCRDEGKRNILGRRAQRRSAQLTIVEALWRIPLVKNHHSGQIWLETIGYLRMPVETSSRILIGCPNKAAHLAKVISSDDRCLNRLSMTILAPQR